ncbi:hypothetical protein [Pantanalinema sp. GBBB05]|uniref:hypothetical protein n=1 Tax=Pantanalinema sp. GBBB05 TaxID=2604139 RepID=UPI001D314CDF|nr:hypothetical protein [Pantanalinema sp. GBBB05]
MTTTTRNGTPICQDIPDLSNRFVRDEPMPFWVTLPRSVCSEWQQINGFTSLPRPKQGAG